MEPIPGNQNMTYYDLLNQIYGDENPPADQLEEWGVANQTFQKLYDIGSHRPEDMLVT